jgi:DsbC/DsbD-like thiol-disulfide interchange protein
MIKHLLILAVFCLAAFGFAQNEAPSMKVTFPKAVKAGSKVKAMVEISFVEGLHGYQNPPSTEWQIPVKLSVQKTIKVLKVEYPKGVPMKMAGDEKPSAVYEGTIKVPVWIIAPKTVGKNTIKFILNYQQCNEETCFPPSSIEAVGSVLVTK